MDKVARGEVDDQVKEGEKDGGKGEDVEREVVKVEDGGVEPPQAEFVLDVRNVPALDL